MKWLYLCTANVCRSPAAEYYTRHLFERLGVRNVEVASAGILEMGGQPADPIVVRLLGKMGIDLSGHHSRRLTPEWAREMDEIIVMERRHRQWVRDNIPEVLPRVSLIREPEDRRDLDDPTGGSLEEYRRAMEMLQQCIERRTLAIKYPS
jgi:protein-tyrosine-phosphatase